MPSSVTRGKPECYLFVIDTDTYAGGFEREMCAYITGQIGECEVGKEQALIAQREIPKIVAKLEELIESVPDEHGCCRPVSIFPTPGWFNNGIGGDFRRGQEAEALVHYKKETEKYYNEAPLSYAKHLREKIRAESQREIAKANARTKVPKHPAYMSVAIYFHTPPDKDTIEVMKERAKCIASKGVGLKGFEWHPKVEGFRILKQRITHERLNS
ncbi:hypothetical protein HY642_02400 [Candidatus Woesearchaeota archaeon]|nr:hypothetical protein [Candidatus Woesearchaeota archaeon]